MLRDVAFYLDRGFDQAWAEYFASGRKRAVEVWVQSGLTIAVRYDDGQGRLYDCAGFIEPGTVFEPLMDPRVFSRVYIDGDGSICWDIDADVDSTRVWSNKIDISADVCYVEGVVAGLVPTGV